jgi:hypothetical protein
MKLAASSVLLIFSVPVFGQSLTGNAAAAFAEKRVETLKLFSAPGLNPDPQATPPGRAFSPPGGPRWIVNKIRLVRQRVCASPLLEAKPPANREDVMPVIRPSPPPTGNRDTIAPAPACGESASTDR